MCILERFQSDLQEYLTGIRYINHNIIRKHSRKLEELGDISFPLKIENWYHLIDNERLGLNKAASTIFDYSLGNGDLNLQVEELKENSKNWQISIADVFMKNSNVHLFLERLPGLYSNLITYVLRKNDKYGTSKIVHSKLTLELDENVRDLKLESDLSTLRLLLLRDVTQNLLKFVIGDKVDAHSVLYFTLNHIKDGRTNILCGPVLNEKGLKDDKTVAKELFSKRSCDMRMMAQHKYGVQIKPNTLWESYFEKLGKAAVTLEILSNKPQKAIKITLNDLQTANKGASFIFYNCARLAALFRELEKKISGNIYPELPSIDKVDFSLLNQPEEWELFYVYILQYPSVIKNCIKDIEKGILNPQCLISFLSSLSSVFSIYYRRVRILTDPRTHLFAVLYARIYLLKALQCVIHNSLYLLNIEPVKEM